MINNRLFTENRPPMIRPEYKPKNLISQETFIHGNIHSYFQLAKIIVTKVSEIEAQSQKVILVVDDEPLTFKLIEEFFQEAKLSCTMLQATTGNSAYEIAVSKLPDLIITDWLMPELDGIGLIKKLKANPETRAIPVIMATGALLPNDEFNKVLAAGAIDCIRKPFDDSELIARVKTALALHDALMGIKENKESIHAKNPFLHFLLDVAPDPIFFMDKTGLVLGCNQGFESLIGNVKDEATGTSIHELFPKFANHFMDEAPRIEAGMVSRFEIEFINRARDKRSLLITCIGLGNASAEIVVGSITDVTEIIQSSKNAMIDLEINVERLQTELDSKHQKLTTQAELLIHSKNVKSNLIESITKLQPYLTHEGKARFFSLLKQIHWELNDEMELQEEKDFDQLHSKFYLLLEKICPSITRNEKRLCAYLKVNHSASDISKITNKSLNSINVAFARLRTKLQLPNSKGLRNFLLDLT